MVNEKPKENVFQEQTNGNAFGKKKTTNIMDDDDIFGSITGGTTQTVNQPIQPVQKQQDDDPFGLMGLNVGGNPQPTNTFVQPSNSGFDMGLLGFGNPNPPQTQPVVNNQNTGGFNLLGNDFLGMGGSQPTQPAQQTPNNFNQAPNTGFGFNQQPNQQQNQGFNWGVQPQVQPNPQVNQTQQNPNKFLAYENPQV